MSNRKWRTRGRTYQRCGQYRSAFEQKLATALTAQGVKFEYETVKIPFVEPAQPRTYHPDFILPNGIFIEAKGLFDAEDRKKMLLVKEQRPDLDIRIVFTNAYGKIYPGSPTTRAAWCAKHGYQWAHKTIPAEWLTKRR